MAQAKGEHASGHGRRWYVVVVRVGPVAAVTVWRQAGGIGVAMVTAERVDGGAEWSGRSG